MARDLTRKEKVKIYTLSTLAYSYIKVLDMSFRFNNVNFNPEMTPAIYAVWHGWQYGLLGLSNRKQVHLLVSPSNDGEIISRISTMLGYSIIRGSQGRGGTEALRTIIKTLKRGDSIAYTVDGPRGPIYKVKNGVLKIAQMAQVPIIPLVPATKTKVHAKSWDQYNIPFYFSKVVNLFGDPIYIPKELNDDELENYRQNLEDTLLDLRKKAESML